VVFYTTCRHRRNFGFYFHFFQFRFKESVKDKLEDLETEVGKEHDEVIWHFLYILKSKSGVEITSYIIAPFTGLKISVGHGHCPTHSSNCPTYRGNHLTFCPT
jgi:hypothetical protein